MPSPSPVEFVLGIVLYENPPEQLGRLVDSLDLARAQAATPSFEVRWLDHSKESSAERRELLTRPYARYDFQGANRGFGAGHNRLLGETWPSRSASAYVCINPDATLHPACLAELHAERKRHPGAGLVEARQTPQEHPKPYHPISHETPWCSGCVLLITRPLYEAIGGFDERFFLYCEDVDLSWRARGRGFGTYLAPNAIVHHPVDGRPPSREKDRQFHRSAAWLGAKYGADRFSKAHLRHYQSLGGKPFALRMGRAPRAPMKTIVDFDHGLSFAEARW